MLKTKQKICLHQFICNRVGRISRGENVFKKKLFFGKKRSEENEFEDVH